MGGGFKWIKPEVYPLMFYIGVTVGMAGFALGRVLSAHPMIRVNKDDRQSALLHNYKEGQTYYEHGLRKYLATQKYSMMPAINDYLTGKTASK